MKLLDTKVSFHNGDTEKPLIIGYEQDIPDDHLDRLKQARHESTQRRMGDFERVASIPTVVVEKWLREGFNIYQESAKAILARLSAENLGAFVTTNRVI